MGYFVYMDLKYIETYVFVFIYGIEGFFYNGKLDVFMKLKCIEIVGIGL